MKESFVFDENANTSIAEIIVPYILDKIIKRTKEFRHIPQWYGTKRDFIYKIDRDLRDPIYNHIASEEACEKVGFVFGDETHVGGNKFLIGIDGIVPISKIKSLKGNRKIDEKLVRELCDDFVVYLNRENDIDKAVKIGRKLLEFLLIGCARTDFTKLLITKKCGYAKVYNEMYKQASKVGDKHFRRAVMGRFLRTTFKGIYICGERFQKFELFGEFSKLVLDTQRKKLDENAVKNRLEEIEGKIVPDKHIKIFENVKGIIDNLYKFFPSRKEEKIKRWDPLVVPTVVLIHKKSFEKFTKIFKLFEREISHYDLRFSGFNKRIPILLNFYIDKDGKELGNLCMSWNNDSEYKIQQIRHIPAKAKSAYNRCSALVMKYSMFKKVPSFEIAEYQTFAERY